MLEIDNDLELDVAPCGAADCIKLIIWRGEDAEWTDTLNKAEGIALARQYRVIADDAEKRRDDDVRVDIAGKTLTVPISTLRTYSHQIESLARDGVQYLDRIDRYVA